jgi:hypothetical protein
MVANTLIFMGIAIMAVGLGGLLLRIVHGRPEKQAK